uniref:Uncharacterized protein n=1 Tax=Pyxicephalus adspersus TaxID=30357 RepID=A0AAV3AXQ8_PYXAD|nr:TPA: hypothetical protein GDO54_008060 [Pyxicephalus adspersus]
MLHRCWQSLLGKPVSVYGQQKDKEKGTVMGAPLSPCIPLQVFGTVRGYAMNIVFHSLSIQNNVFMPHKPSILCFVFLTYVTENSLENRKVEGISDM